MAEGYFVEAIKGLVDLGLYDVVLPFVFVFTIVFGFLNKSELLGKDGRRYNAMAAFVFGFIAVASLNFLDFFQKAIPITVLLLVGGVFLMIIVGTLGFKPGEHKYVKYASMIFGFLGVLLIINSYTGIFSKLKIPEEFLRAASGVVIGFGVFILIIWWIIRGDSSKKKDKKKKDEKPVIPEWKTKQLVLPEHKQVVADIDLTDKSILDENNQFEYKGKQGRRII